MVRKLFVLITFASLASAMSCGGSSSSSSSPTKPAALVVSGTATKGAYKGATVSVFSVANNGSDGQLLSSGADMTDANGNFSVTLTSALPTGPTVRVKVMGGMFTSEWDGTTVTSSSTISALLDDASAGASGVSVTAVSTFVDSYASGLLKGGKSSSVPSAHSTSQTTIGGFYAIPSGTAVESVTPSFKAADITANPTNFKVGLVVGALTAEGKALNSTDPDALVTALSADISDGIWDGKDPGNPVPLGTGTLPSTAGTSDFLTNLGNYLNTGSTPTANGFTTGTSGLSGVVDAMETGVDACACTPAATGLAATSSGAINSLAFGGHQYLFLAARTRGVVVVDITDPTVASPPIKVWAEIFSNPQGSGGFGATPIGGVTPFVGTAGHPQVLAYAYGTSINNPAGIPNANHVIVLNAAVLATGTPGGTVSPVDGEMDVPMTATLPVGFSGGFAFIGSAVPLGGPLLGLATADGYIVFDASQVGVTGGSPVVKLYPVADTSEIIAENLGGDVSHRFLLGGNEFGGAQLVDLGLGVTKGTSYYVTPANFGTVFPGTQSSSVDANAVDQALQVGILTFEDTGDAEFVDMATITKTPSSGAGSLATWAPAAGGVANVTFGTMNTNLLPLQLSGSAVDSTSHLALFMAGFSTDVAVGQIQDPASLQATTNGWSGLSDWSYYTINSSTSLSTYSDGGDPHADGVVFNLAKGTPYGYVLDGGNFASVVGVVQIDLSGFLLIPRAGMTGDAAHQPGMDPATVTSAAGGKVMHEFAF